MARERGLYRRQDSSYWWIDVVLADGRRVCKSTRCRSLKDAEKYLVRLKAEAYEATHNRIPQERRWQEAVIRYLEDNAAKRSLVHDKDHLRKLDPYLRDWRTKYFSASSQMDAEYAKALGVEV